MEDIEREKMTDERFWGLAMEDEDEAFDYGRDVIKDGKYDNML